jgi:hypothetical protein
MLAHRRIGVVDSNCGCLAGNAGNAEFARGAGKSSGGMP